MECSATCKQKLWPSETCDVVSEMSICRFFVSPVAGRWEIRDLIYTPAAEAATELQRAVPLSELLPQV